MRHVPLAFSLASACALIIAASSFLIGRFANPSLGGWLTAATVLLGHGFFIAFMAAHVAGAGTPPRARDLGLRGAIPVAVLLAAGLALGAYSSWLLPTFWAVATFFALPLRLAMGDWRPSPVPPLHRVVLLLPTTALLALATYVLGQPGVSLGIMEGGVILIPLLLGVLFLASYLMALFSGIFARRT